MAIDLFVVCLLVTIVGLFSYAPVSKNFYPSVTFEPCARTAWHTHPLGQTLIVTAGCGLVQRWGGPIEQVRPGDVVSIAPGEKHWHGATPTTAMTHIAIQEQLDGKTVDWMEKVSDEQYRGSWAVRDIGSSPLDVEPELGGNHHALTEG